MKGRALVPNLEIKLATRRADALRCQYLIAEAYNRNYDIFFSSDAVNLDARIEPYPDRYAMGIIDGELVATAGLYLRATYIERFGQVSDDDIDTLLKDAGVFGRYCAQRKREYTKLVIRDDWEGRGLGLQFFMATHCRDFLQLETDEPCIISCCAKVSIFHQLYETAGIRARLLKPFPVYQVHSLYRSAEDPMESRIIVPELDIPPDLYNRTLPAVYEVSSALGA
jgi:hypothetical protein